MNKNIFIVLLLIGIVFIIAGLFIKGKIIPETREQQAIAQQGQPSSSIIGTFVEEYSEWISMEPYPKVTEIDLGEGRYRIEYKTEPNGTDFVAYRNERPQFYKIKDKTDGIQNIDVNVGEAGKFTFIFGTGQGETPPTKGYLGITKIADFKTEGG
jgi:hypothetical protein